MSIHWRAARAAATGLFVLLGACASVPDLDRAMMRRDPGVPQIEGMRGALTNAQSKKIIDDLKKRVPDTGILERHVAIEETLAGSPLSVGNKAITLEDGQITYRETLASIQGARRHVHVEMYIFEDDEIGKLFAAALKERAAAGVKVRMIYDSVGSMHTPKEFWKDLEAGGVQVAEYNPVNTASMLNPAVSLQHRDHRKLVVVDGAVAFLGGINISAVYGSMSGSMGGRRVAESTAEPFERRPWRDLQIRLEGPAVADVQRLFVKQWAVVKKETIDDPSLFPQAKREGAQIVRIMEGAPSEGVNALYVALISAIESAEVEVVIMNSYFVPHPQLQQALEDAARRGVDVKLILPGRSDNALVYHAGRSYYDDLLEAGVKIYERRTRMLHAKSAMVDGVWSTIGSTNLDWRSLVYNDELNAVVLGPDFAKSIGAVFEKDIADSEPITLENWRSRPVSDRIKEAASRAWAQLL